jgi:hypothetical protein
VANVGTNGPRVVALNARTGAYFCGTSRPVISFNVVWVRSKPHRSFKLKGKRWQNKRRKLPIPTALMEKLPDRMIARDAKPSDLIFPNTIGGAEGHFLRKLQAIAERAGNGTRTSAIPKTLCRHPC